MTREGLRFHRATMPAGYGRTITLWEATLDGRILGTWDRVGGGMVATLSHPRATLAEWRGLVRDEAAYRMAQEVTDPADRPAFRRVFRSLLG